MESIFKLRSDYVPSGDQPQAIASLVEGLNCGKKDQVLLGVTGSGKTFTMANVIAQVNRPALVIAHNKTLAAQLCAEFREFFPENAVEYFISYYDYYQPEAYIPSRDAYIEKEADINEEIDRLRHSATRSLLTRRDVIIVASVSCIYGLGAPEDYMKGVIQLRVGDVFKRRDLLLALDQIQYERNDLELLRGRYRVKGDVIDIFPSWEEHVVRLDFFGEELERVMILHPVTGEVLDEKPHIDIFPATHYVVNQRLDSALEAIKQELDDRVAFFKSQDKIVEAHRIEQRTKYDMEMMAEVGYCKGIENYSRVIAGRRPGEPSGVLLDFFPDDFITIIDESHVTVPQIGGMYKGDRARKLNLIDFGFRLPSAEDNRPLKFHEFEEKVKQAVYVSATPGNYELEKVYDPSIRHDNNWDKHDIVEQIIRPTGLVDPIIEIKPTTGQIDVLMSEIKKRVDKKERVLVTTLTKQMSEDLNDYLEQHHFKVCYLHSDIKALDRIDILHKLRKGTYDVLVGVNLLREGLDLPEVSLVAIMDADKEGFLRNERSLIQTMGRAARNINGTVLLFADKMTDSMTRAIRETERRRKIQLAYNETHGITPTSVTKKLTDIRDEDRKRVEESEKILRKETKVEPSELPAVIKKLEQDMKEAAKNLEFELAAVIRDQIHHLQNMKD